jgi:hypothetical protein
MGNWVVFGLGWSLVLYPAMQRIPATISSGQAYGGGLALTGAALVLLMARRRSYGRTTLVFALTVLLLLGTSTAGAISTMLGTAAVLGWVRTSRRSSGGYPSSPTSEVVSGVGTIGLAVGVAPTSPLVIVLCIWLFYLWQVLPLAVADQAASFRSAINRRSQFEAIRRRVERLLAARM